MNFNFKSPRGLVKNSPIQLGALILKHLEQIQTELRYQRADLKDCNLKLQRLMIDKHLEMQVDKYFEETSPQTDPVTEIDKLQYQQEE